MRLHARLILLSAVLLAATTFSRAQSLIENGNFDNAEPLKGWVSDYAWTGNSNYLGNKNHVSIITEGARKNVVKMDSPGTQGVKIECRAFPFEPGFRYTCTLDVKGGGYRVYFAGYRFAPGVRPHENPELGELRLIYQSKAAVGTAADWKQEKLELPGVKPSPAGIEQLKQIRYVTLYIWFMKPGYVDNVVVTKVADPSLKF
ncbi:MAG: hypothetical protein ABIP20_04165 [Chthoniobacteraceae bacterium]